MSALVLLVLASASAPDRVVVFPDRAQVTRSVQVQCGAAVEVHFENVPPSAARDSFRAQLTGGTIDGLRAELIAREKAFSPKVEALQTQLEALRVEQQATVDALTRARRRSEEGGQFAAIAAGLVSREMTAERADPKAWSTAFDASLDTSLEAAKELSELDATLRAQQRRGDELRRQLGQLQQQSREAAWTVDVLASCPAGKTAELTLTYLVGGASWVPAYEARADEGRRSVELSTWATVTQLTGEDWSGVKLTLSTAVPSQNATPPQLKVLQVRAAEREPAKKVLARREEYMPSSQVASSPEQPRSDEGQASGKRVSNQGLSVQLEVPERSKVPGDGRAVRLFVGRDSLRASFELRATPRLMPVAFRVAELRNDGAWPLLPGEVSAFRSTGMVGRFPLEHVPMGGAFTLTFGVEDQVRVKRVIVDELVRDTGLFNGNKRFSYAYRFELANYGSEAREVTVVDSLPVSELDDLKVSIGEKTTGGYALDAARGLVKWSVKLAPGEKKHLDYAFRVDVPNSYDTGGL